MSVVYLGGPINGCTDEEARGWREEVKPLLESLGHTWLDPMDRDYRGRELEPEIAKQIVEFDKQDIIRADVLLMSCPRASTGSAMEILFAYDRSKFIIAVIPEDFVPSPWLMYHTTMYRGSIKDAVELYLKEPD